MAYGYNPFGGGYGQPTQQMVQQAAQQAYMQQMGGMGQMAQQPAQMQQPNVISRMVTSRDEATTAQIPFDSTINVFLNPSAGEIYVKRFNPNTGGAWFDDYISAAKMQQVMQAQEAQKTAPEYATVEMMTALENRVSELADAMNAKRTRGAKTDE